MVISYVIVEIWDQYFAGVSCKFFFVMEGLSKNEGVRSGVVSYKPAQFLYETNLSHINCEAKL